jgi:cell pole-organizing protein PopZ
VSVTGAGYFQVTAEPKMEDLLASIRKAIQDDIGEAPLADSRGTVFKGAMRELRVKLGDETERQAPEAADIEDIRNRIHRNRAMDEFARPAPAEPPRAAGFAGILGGTVARPAEPPPDLRPSYGEDDTAAYEAEYYADPHGQTDYGYGDPHYDGYGQDVQQAEAAYLPPPQTAYEDGRYEADPPIMSPEASAAANAAFSRLADALVGRSTGDRSVEDVARDMLRGMLKQWLDENLPALVEQLVREEIERVARRGR